MNDSGVQPQGVVGTLAKWRRQVKHQAVVTHENQELMSLGANNLDFCVWSLIVNAGRQLKTLKTKHLMALYFHVAERNLPMDQIRAHRLPVYTWATLPSSLYWVGSAHIKQFANDSHLVKALTVITHRACSEFILRPCSVLPFSDLSSHLIITGTLSTR